MNPLIKKEIRLMLPAWLAVLVLEAALPWIFSYHGPTFEAMPYFFFLGIMIPAVSSFGREFSSGTFQMLMSQPVERQRIWKVKMAVLAGGSILILLAYYLSCSLVLSTTDFDSYDGYGYNNTYNHMFRASTYDAYWMAIIAGPIVGLVALTGGLWSTLLFRQVSTGFWITLLAPAGLATVAFYFIPARASNHMFHLVLGIMAGVYILAGLWAARRLFYSAQDVGWTGGIISLDRWRYFEKQTGTSIGARIFRPIRAILQKEFQLHAITLVGAFALLLLQIIAFFVRAHYLKINKNSDIIAETDFLWCLWLLIPMVIGCTAIAEERRPGILDNQFCLPVSKRSQFIIKFFPAIILGVLLGGLVPVALETLAKKFGSPNEMFTTANDNHPAILGWSILYLSFGFSLAGIYGSTLAKNFLQAFGIAIVVMIGCFFLVPGVDALNHIIDRYLSNSPDRKLLSYYGVTAGVPIPIFVITGLIIIPLGFICISYLNFSHAFDATHIWRRNTLVLGGSVVVACVLARGVYYRPWELLSSLNPTATGPVRLSSATPVQISTGYLGDEDVFSAVLPDGRLWVKYIIIGDNGTISRSDALQNFQNFMGKSNWITAVVACDEIVGIRADGTLWDIQKVIGNDGAASLNLSRIGGDADWLQVATDGLSCLLLQKNGTLWTWGKFVPTTVGNPPYQSTVYEHLDPERLGGDTNWAKIIPGSPVYVEKNDGSPWEWVEGQVRQNGWPSESMIPTRGKDKFFQGAEVKTDGTLWFHYQPIQSDVGLHTSTSEFVPVQLGADSKWKSAIYDEEWPSRVLAVRNDGTLWKWEFGPQDDPNFAQVRPAQLGDYSGWITISSLNGSAITLAADGSLWAWDRPDYIGILGPSRKPEFIANIFEGETEIR